MPTLRTKLLDPWEADAFVFAHVPDNEHHEPSAAEEEALRIRIGPRLVEYNLNRSVPQSFVQQANATWLRSWKTKGHPVEQWATRLLCYKAVLQHEVSRGYPYEFYFRVRLDTIFFRTVPTAFRASLRGSNCTVMIPTGENFKGVNDRMIIADRCGFRLDSHMLDFMLTAGDTSSIVYIRGKSHNETWNPELAQKALLESGDMTVLREPMPNCILRDTHGTSCSVTAWQSLSISARLMPTLLQTDRWLCGLSLKNASTDEPCDKERRKIVYHNHSDRHKIEWPYDANFTDDLGFCKLQDACQSTEGTLPPTLLGNIRTDDRGADPTQILLTDSPTEAPGVLSPRMM
jgi:hypothetical protein